MKLAVFFGSFNPLTNAHIAALKTAVAALQADRGLFVATNGKYLRRKTVKIGDPFYLPQEERQAAIEQVCATEPQLEFWGFELGGINPSRYKTLCKIQKQYPDAELFEIMGADKVHTLTKSASAADYLRDIRFAVFCRNGADVESLLAADPLLAQHRDNFVLLPALADAAVSSSLVRERFRAGQDFSDLVPASTVALLSRYKPEDFSISYGERMAVMMASGRFGARQACKTVYGDNAKLFHSWKQGGEPDLGDFSAFLDGTRLYTREYSVAGQGKSYHTTITGCINADCVDVARQLINAGYDPAILNLASARSPGGGYHQGYAAQEESLCHSSNLSLSLYQFGSTRYKHIRECGAPHKADGYPLDLNFGGIYTPNVTFFRYGKSGHFALREQPFRCDVITVAALSFNGRSCFAGVDELSFRSANGGFTPEGEAVMLNKIRTIFRMGVEQGKDALVLGAFGCGAYRLPSDAVAELFRRVLTEPEFAGKFRLLVFAILERSRKPQGLDGKFAPFYQTFGTFTL